MSDLYADPDTRRAQTALEFVKLVRSTRTSAERGPAPPELASGSAKRDTGTFRVEALRRIMARPLERRVRKARDAPVRRRRRTSQQGFGGNMIAASRSHPPGVYAPLGGAAFR